MRDRTDTEAHDAWGAVRNAVAAVADGREDAVVLGASSGRRRWVQLTRVVGEDALLCEAVSDEYLDRFHELPQHAGLHLRSLHWRGGAEATFAQWADVATEDERDELARFLVQTLVEALGHDPGRPPKISHP